MRQGLIDAGGSHEPYIFIVRRGGQRIDARQVCDAQQSEKLIRQLHDAGVEVFHTHLYKGFGMEAEQEEMEETRKAVAIAHQLGMKADTYIQWNSMMYETFFAEEPKAADWIQRDVAGLPILLEYGYQQSFRYRPCFSNQDYLDYLKKVVRYAIVEAKTDFIHFDNFDLNAEPDSCHCAACKEGFRKRLRAKYSSAQLRERFGFERVDFVNPPQWNRDNLPGGMQIIFDPAIQEWIDYRCQSMADALEQMHDYAMSLNPEVALEINPGGITGNNRAWESAVDHARLLKFTKAFWSEEDEVIGYHSDGRLVTRIRSYKLARAFSNVLLAYLQDNALALSEALAFNQTLGCLGVYPISQVTGEYLEFYRQNREMYVDSVDMANVGLLRSYASLTYNNAEVQLSTELAEQALIEAGIPFDLVFDDGLRDLSKYKTLILPNCECLSDAQISLLRGYVERGGGLIVIGQSGLYDEWRRVRTTPGLAGMVGSQESAKEYQQEVVSGAEPLGTTTRMKLGQGRVAYLPAMEFDGALPPMQPYFPIGEEFWKRPKNWKEFVELVNWATDDQALVRLNAPRGIVINYTSQPMKQRVFIHVVNYEVSNAPNSKAIEVGVRIPENREPLKVTVHAPGTNAEQQIKFARTGAYATFTLSEVQSYCAVKIEW
ncbi:MAG: alpha-amylase family protein [Terracidiphilus sp.]